MIKEESYKDPSNGGGISWQWYAGLGGVGDITLIPNSETRLAHVNTKSFQRSEEGQFLMQAIRVT